MSRENTHYIFVTGGVISGIGKGITAASIGAVLRAHGLKVTTQKLDPYLNVDAGLLNPAEHGECFVTKDGAETDLDLGHYERFLDIEMTQSSSTMSGWLLRRLIEDERAGKFGGKTIQYVPHFTGAVQQSIIEASQGSDVHIVEIGGTVGDIEAAAVLEAVRELAAKVGRSRYVFAHVVYVPYLGTSKEFKTKPAQNAVRDLRSIGIMPDLLLARTEKPVHEGVIEKLSMFSGVARDGVVLLPNAKTVYEVPLTLQNHGIDKFILNHFGIESGEADMSGWQELVKIATTTYDKTVRIGMVAKYLSNEDTYLCVVEALRAASWEQRVNFELTWVDAEKLEHDGTDELKEFDGLVVPGGFGTRGLEGKIAAARFAMDHKKPYLGLCLGLQMAVIAAARKAGLSDATTGEIDSLADHQVIYIMAGQEGKESTGGTMRLGNYTCKLEPGSLAAKTYDATEIVERHRHRYEVNQAYRDQIEAGGLKLSGFSPDGRLVEMVEAVEHPYFLATQAHPEFLSRPNRPHPMFRGFIAAAVQQQNH
ncbi:MAG TPA: CTP synthase [Candidatus Acidoferrum sp.]|nr:CTP synthase [Candidatus Acidoferrum sp.]